MSNLFSKFKVCLQLNQKRLKTSGLQKPSWIPFSKAKFGEFIQQKPSLNNAFTDDGFVQRLIRHYLPKNVLTEVTPDLTRFGERIVSEIEDIGRQCELQQPKLYFDDGWGKVETRLWTSSAWKKQKEISAEEGLVAIAYERNFREFSRIYQLMKLYLYIPSSGLYSCPLAMTDGAAKTIEDLQLNESFYKNAYTRLTSRDPNLFWTSGQWMTEKGGGSDVARGTETLAIPEGDKTFRLYGYKWFSSATDSDVTLTLARISDLEGNVLSGTRGLTLFFLKTRENDKLNNIQIVKLKDKLGTRQLPTAELLLDGTLAYKISEEGRGVASMGSMLQITRFHNAIGSAAGMRRILLYSRDYMFKRRVFGKYLHEYPLHVQTLCRMDIEARGAMILVSELGKLLGKQECNCASDEELLLLRILNPVLKLYSAKQTIDVVSEGLESFGGLGYMEDAGFASRLRDAQVLPIWEGTTNVLSMDVLRVLMKTHGEALRAFYVSVNQKLNEALSKEETRGHASKILNSMKSIENILRQNPMILEVGARDFAYSLARIYTAALLLEFACSEHADKSDKVTAERWILSQDLCPFLTNFNLNMYSKEAIADDSSIVLDGYQKADNE